LLRSNSPVAPGENKGEYMKRIDSALRTGVAFAALATIASAAAAQSTLPPPDVVTGQAPPAAPAPEATGPLERSNRS
jgi:hypothetical protein